MRQNEVINNGGDADVPWYYKTARQIADFGDYYTSAVADYVQMNWFNIVSAVGIAWVRLGVFHKLETHQQYKVDGTPIEASVRLPFTQSVLAATKDIGIMLGAGAVLDVCQQFVAWNQGWLSDVATGLGQFAIASWFADGYMLSLPSQLGVQMKKGSALETLGNCAAVMSIAYGFNLKTGEVVIYEPEGAIVTKRLNISSGFSEIIPPAEWTNADNWPLYPVAYSAAVAGVYWLSTAKVSPMLNKIGNAASLGLVIAGAGVVGLAASPSLYAGVTVSYILLVQTGQFGSTMKLLGATLVGPALEITKICETDGALATAATNGTIKVQNDTCNTFVSLFHARIVEQHILDRKLGEAVTFVAVFYNNITNEQSGALTVNESMLQHSLDQLEQKMAGKLVLLEQKIAELEQTVYQLTKGANVDGAEQLGEAIDVAFITELNPCDLVDAAGNSLCLEVNRGEL